MVLKCGLSICPSVKLMHPAKAIDRNVMSFGSDTHVVTSNIVLDRGPSPPPEGRYGDQNPSQNLHCISIVEWLL